MSSYSKTIVGGILFPKDFIIFREQIPFPSGLENGTRTFERRSDEKRTQVRDLDFTEIRSTNTFPVCGNKFRASAVWKRQQVKIL
jgi:hypothetical protein